MTHVYLHPSDSRLNHDEAKQVATSTESLEDIRDFIPTELLSRLEHSSIAGDVTVHGTALPKEQSPNRSHFETMDPGDVVLRSHGGYIISSGIVIGTLKSEDLATELGWETPDGKLPYLVYFLRDVQPEAIPYDKFREITGKEYQFQMFRRLDAETSQAALRALPFATNGPNEEFESRTQRQRRTLQQTAVERDPRFVGRVLGRYGAKCAFCDLSVDAVLDAAHIVPVSEDGSSDPRNGLVLCATHHRAFDAGLIRIEPETREIVVDGVTRDELRLTRKTLTHLPEAPHRKALEWHWRRFQD